jgi:hypothetical protein
MADESVLSMSAGTAARTLTPAQFVRWMGSLKRTLPCCPSSALQMEDSTWAGGVFHDFYSILGIAESASDDDVKRAFATQVLQSHPDKQGPLASDAQRSAASDRTRTLLQAKNVLLDSARRVAYDAKRARRKAAGSSHDQPQPSGEFSSMGAEADMAQVWEVWIHVVIEGFKHKYNTGSAGDGAIHVMCSILPPLGFRMSALIATIMNHSGVIHTLRDQPPPDQELFMAAIEALCKQMWH